MKLNDVDLQEDDRLASARGLVNGLLLSTILWAIIFSLWAILFWALI